MKRNWVVHVGLWLGLCGSISQALAQEPPGASPKTDSAPPPELPSLAPPPSAPASDELDVRWTKPYAEAVQSKSDLIILGESLDATMSRIELARWLTNVFEIRPAAKKKDTPIKDVPKNSPDYFNVQALLQAGVMSAYPGSLFKPQGDLTRLEALAIFGRALKLAAPSKPAVESWLGLYSDTAAVPQAGREFIAAAAQAGLVVNVPDAKKLGPDDVLTRGEVAVLMHQSLVYQKKLAAVEAPVAQIKIERPTIASIQVQPDAKVTPGQAVTVTAKGTPGAQAKFDLADLATGVAMQESSPGEYTGTYKVTDKDAIINPTVTVRLDRGGLATQAQRIAKLEVGNTRTAQAPRDTYPDDELPPMPSQSPRRAGGFDNSYGSRSAAAPSSSPRSAYDDDGFPAVPPPNNNAGVSGSFDSYSTRGGYGYGNPNPYGTSPGGGSFGTSPYGTRPGSLGGSFGTSPYGTRPGSLGGSFGAPGYGNPPIITRRSSGDLFSPPSPFDPVQRPNRLRIRQVSVDPANRVLHSGDVLTVSLEGDGGGKATFRILGYTGPITMKEITPGFYEATVQIGKNINVPGGTIEVALEREGQRTTRNINESINISSNR
ncbi:S-layer homology domain-containing protein [Gloeobacter morelensis]|uniref:S-layer homology domain-containing protein n=1 Tax=Gloeobacter morelensis MG652769 TaxID=2781736 RepID=A0ABY3PHZ6_9CYAN|nr:S-layer homology domain-containing protein [Gloeobacter morelensis]UFP93233.1 S-layer homology domain-containing protein [Gloeobacter morelensis MG652769]